MILLNVIGKTCAQCGKMITIPGVSWTVHLSGDDAVTCDRMATIYFCPLCAREVAWGLNRDAIALSMVDES